MNSILFVGLGADCPAPATAGKLGLSVLEREGNVDPNSLSRCKLLVFAAHCNSDLDRLKSIQQRCKPVHTLVLAAEALIDPLKWDLSPQFEVLPLSAPHPLVNAAVTRVAHALRLHQELKFYRRQATRAPELIGHHPAFRALLKERDRLARSMQPLVLIGAPGTGKQTLARTIHRIATAEGPFIQAACAQFPELLSDYLFRGIAGQPSCITLANGGTLLITELESASIEVQEELAALLARQSGPERAKARLICTVHGAGAFDSLVPALRKELTALHVPELKERGMDVQLLAEHFLKHAYDPLKRSQVYLCENARNALQKYHWPGNIAELRLVMARARQIATTDVITLADCGLPGNTTQLTNSKTIELATPVSAGTAPSQTATLNTVVVEIGQPLDAIEKEVIVRTLEKTRGNRTKAAEILGISVRTLYTKLQEIGSAAESKGQLVATKAGKSASDWAANR